MNDHLIGQSAALFTALLWTMNSILFAAAGRRIGALSVNALRIAMAVVLLGLAHLVLFGTLTPEANFDQWLYLGLSGIIGLGIGDFGYFSSLVKIGPRKAILLMSTAPIFTVVSAFFILDEVPGFWSYVGMAVTLAGVMIVIVERKPQGEATATEPHPPKQEMILGVLAGLLGGAGQGVGLVVSKYGMEEVATGDAMDPLAATFVRMVVACVFIWVVVVAGGKVKPVLETRKDREAMKRTAGGAVLGPFLGVWMSMVAISLTYTGVAATLMSLMPVIVIPLVWILYKQKTNWQGIAGALVAVAGVAILFLL